jgi:hypothetical protein
LYFDGGYLLPYKYISMQQDQSKSDSSVKAGLQIEGDKKPFTAGTETATEQDADELVHEQQEEYPTDSVEHDLDEIVHEQGSITTAKENDDELTEEEDMDDLVHRNANHNEEQDR